MALQTPQDVATRLARDYKSHELEIIIEILQRSVDAKVQTKQVRSGDVAWIPLDGKEVPVICYVSHTSEHFGTTTNISAIFVEADGELTTYTIESSKIIKVIEPRLMTDAAGMLKHQVEENCGSMEKILNYNKAADVLYQIANGRSLRDILTSENNYYMSQEKTYESAEVAWVKWDDGYIYPVILVVKGKKFMGEHIDDDKSHDAYPINRHDIVFVIPHKGIDSQMTLQSKVNQLLVQRRTYETFNSFPLAFSIIQDLTK